MGGEPMLSEQLSSSLVADCTSVAVANRALTTVTALQITQASDVMGRHYDQRTTEILWGLRL
eukprot:4983145-Amphidinium_carterae.1